MPQTFLPLLLLTDIGYQFHQLSRSSQSLKRHSYDIVIDVKTMEVLTIASLAPYCAFCRTFQQESPQREFLSCIYFSYMPANVPTKVQHSFSPSQSAVFLKGPGETLYFGLAVSHFKNWGFLGQQKRGRSYIFFQEEGLCGKQSRLIVLIRT